MAIYTRLIRPLLFRFDAEKIHDTALRMAAISRPIAPLLYPCFRYTDPRLVSEVAGIRFENPFGLAAGYDKSGRAVDGLAALGFGFIEVGSVSADPSDGNPRPRLWRLPTERAIIVNYGLPNDGADAVAARLGKKQLSVPLGINIVKTNRLRNESDEAIIDDYVRSTRVLREVGDYHVLSLSCPNTENGRNFFADTAHIKRLFEQLAEYSPRPPVFLKISPLGGPKALEDILEAIAGIPYIAGFMFNLPPGKPTPLHVPPEELERMPGAVAGKPVEALINKAIADLYRLMDRSRYSIIGVGGVFSAEDAYRKIRLGASLVQLLTALVYEGPLVVKRINRGLIRLLERDGFSNIAQAVGVDSR